MGTWRGVELTGVALAEPRPGGLRLRPHRPGDAAVEFSAMQDRSLHEFLRLPDPYTEADARAWCGSIAPGYAERGEGLQLALVGPDDVSLGSAGLRLPPDGSEVGEIGYCVHAGARGRALAARAARLLASWGFAHGVERIEVRAAVGNLASVHSALRAGFRFESVCRAGASTPAGVVDGAVFVRVRTDPGEAVPVWLPPMDDVHDDVLALRPVVASDADVLAAELADPGARRWVIGDPPVEVVAAARSTAARAPLGWRVGPATRLAMVERSGGAVAGTLELRRGGPPDVVELGYTVLPAFRGRGVTTRALRLFAAWAFDHTDVARLELGADVANLASQRAAERAGFTREGVSPGRLRRVDGSFADEARYGLVRPDADTVG